MLEIKVDRSFAQLRSEELLTAGTVGARLSFEFSEDWDGLHKTAVFTNGRITVDVLEESWDGAVCTVPHECLAQPYSRLRVGVYGVSSDGSMAIPTVYADCGIVHVGADPSGDESAEPTLPVWEQIQHPDLSVYYTRAETDELLRYAGKVKSVNGTQPDEDGNVALDIPAPDMSLYYTKSETDAKLGDVTALINAL